MSTTTQETVEMTSTAAIPNALRTPPTAAAWRSRRTRRRALALAALILTLSVLSVGTWMIVDRVAGRSAAPASAATFVPAWTPIASPWLARLEVLQTKRQLVSAGYSIKVDGNLDAVTKSALADYLQLDRAHPLSPFLADALRGTVITGFRNPAAWNSRFGLHRLTKFVERPLTGPGGQLDANGNLRAPIAATLSRRRAVAAAPKNGKIAFVDRTETLNVINPNGSGLRRLAACAAAAKITGCDIRGYAWSPNARQLAFLRGHIPGAAPDVTNLSLYVINANGSGIRRLAHPRRTSRIADSPVAWSPDGSRIVFVGADGLYVIRASTGAQIHLTDSRGDADPAWSPSGSTIVFARGNSLYAIEADGSALTKLAAVAGAVGHPDWAPDGTRIVFDGLDEIYAVKADGSQLELLHSGGSAGSGPATPSWSPDGRDILFFNNGFTAEVWVMKRNGSHARRLYHSPCCVAFWHPPIWSPDGKSIAVSADSCSRDCSFARRAGGIVLMDRNGRHRRRLSRSESEIAWQPIPRVRAR
jgi:Tol biopolymer transport system component